MKIYIIRSKDGKYLRTGRYETNRRVSSIEDAYLYTKIGATKGQVTFWATPYPEYGIPEILEFALSEKNATVLDCDTSRLKDAINTQIDRTTRSVEEYHTIPGHVEVCNKKNHSLLRSLTKIG